MASRFPAWSERCRQQPGSVGGQRQRGAVLLAMLALITLFGLYLFVKGLNATQLNSARLSNGATSMALARQALIAEALAPAMISNVGFMPLPDRGVNLIGGSWVAAEGIASQNFLGNAKDRSLIGKFPWDSLNTGVLRDAMGNCLWYVVSGRFKVTPRTDALNWDTLGQLDVINASGTTIATNLAALVIAPGAALSGQNRSLSNNAYRECAGNYDARQYLDPYLTTQSINGQFNYFSGGEVAPDASNKTFVLADNTNYNDRLIFIHPDDIFNPLIKRHDFALIIALLLDHFKAQNDAVKLENDAITARNQPKIAQNLINASLGLPLEPLEPLLPRTIIAGAKGTDNLLCPPEDSLLSIPLPTFCKNWKEMLFLTELPTPTPITIDGTTSSETCGRVLIFGGRRSVTQIRITAADRSNKHNYLELPNNSSFSVPVASATSFKGMANFDAANASADLLRCLL